jgi:hypothetical protein
MVLVVVLVFAPAAI